MKSNESPVSVILAVRMIGCLHLTYGRLSDVEIWDEWIGIFEFDVSC